MTNEEEFIERWRREESIYLSWGRFIAQKLRSLIDDRISPVGVDVFLRVPVTPRIKEEKSLLQKAFYRHKGYSDPYNDIEDKVGLRYVVLLSYDVKTIGNAIVAGDEFWIAEKARDFEEERAAKPEEFGYQSLHYVVRSRHGNSHEGTEIPEGTPCEVQVRTLMQHAYSELTHDTIYKPSIRATHEMKRAAAKSMALIEATDDYFVQVANLIAKATAASSAIETTLANSYTSLVGRSSEQSPLNTLLVDHYQKFAGEDFSGRLNEFLQSKPYIADRIKERAPNSSLYSVPAILLAYFAANFSGQISRVDNPLGDDELSLIYSDLGLSAH